MDCVFILEEMMNNKTKQVLQINPILLFHAIEQSSSTIIITDEKGCIEYANPRFIQLTGYSLEEAIGENPRFLKSGKTSSEVYKELWETLASGKEWRGEFCNRKKKGEFYWESASISPVKNAEGIITNFIAIKDDITEKKKMGEALMQSERLKVMAAEQHGRALKTLTLRIISIQEEERGRISRELHDDVGQALTAMKINVEMLEKEIPESTASARRRLADTKQLLTHTLQEIRTLAFELRPSLLDHFGVLSAIRGYSKSYSERTNIDVQVLGKNIVGRFSSEIDILLYRCVQEALNNVVKHSKATNVTIEIVLEEREIHMKIKDNGNGFDVKEAFEENNNGTSIGLLGMKERIASLNGSLKIHSEKNKGSELEILVPFKTNKENSFFEAGSNV